MQGIVVKWSWREKPRGRFRSRPSTICRFINLHLYHILQFRHSETRYNFSFHDLKRWRGGGIPYINIYCRVCVFVNKTSRNRWNRCWLFRTLTSKMWRKKSLLNRKIHHWIWKICLMLTFVGACHRKCFRD